MLQCNARNRVLVVMYGGASVMVKVAFLPQGLACHHGVNHEFHIVPLEENVKIAVRKLKLNNKWILQKHNHSKH